MLIVYRIKHIAVQYFTYVYVFTFLLRPNPCVQHTIIQFQAHCPFVQLQAQNLEGSPLHKGPIRLALAL